MKRFLGMLTFFTRIPIRIKSDLTYNDYVKGVWFLPLVSLIIGVLVSAVNIALRLVSSNIAALLSLMFYLYLTGGLHIDGMADTMDALGSNRDKSRMLEIMKDSRIGTFGVLAIVIYCIAMVTAINISGWTICLLFPIVGRNAAILIGSQFNYAREDGMGKSFIDGTNIWILVIGSVLFIGIILLVPIESIRLISLLAAYLLSLTIIYLTVRKISKKLEGITGDVIGFTIELSQLVFLLINILTYNIIRIVVNI